MPTDDTLMEIITYFLGILFMEKNNKVKKVFVLKIPVYVISNYYIFVRKFIQVI